MTKAEKTKAWREADPERARRSQKRGDLKKYGLSLEQWEEMVSRQRGLCAICGHAPTRHALHVDHDHKTGVVRGLLCDSCNNGLGRFRDDPNRLRRAIAYLEGVDAACGSCG